MDDIQRFDEFEWLLANKVVNENVLPDENVLVYSGHSAFSIGLTELYFVELFYDKYVRVFGSAFIQNKIDALKNETARKWANYAMDWRKRSIPTHEARFNPPTCEQKIGLKTAEKTEHCRSISPKTLKIARKNGALPFTCRERGVVNTEIALKTEHRRSHWKMRTADIQ